MSIRLGVDIGGTFTDLVVYDEETGEFSVTKTPSTPSQFDSGVINGIEKMLEESNHGASDISYLSHGTTVGTNAVLEGELPRLGLVTNEGLRDVVEIGDQTRPELYNLQTDKPPALIPRHLRKEVPGRIDSRGNVVDELDEQRVERVVDELVDSNVESIVVSHLFSFLNDEHEQRIGEIIEAHDSGMPYTLSSGVYPEIREYDRTITTILNEAIKVVIQEYIERLETRIAGMGIDTPVNIMHTGGGILTVDEAIENAVRTVLSGPVAGAVAAENVSRQEQFPNAIGMDMGGTSCDVTMVLDGDILRTTEGEINDLPLKTSMVDVSTVGAGGGSLVWIDEGGALRVGPESSGATPGPICYGRGGTQPTVTDANLLLRRLNADDFLGGEMELDVDRTEQLFRDQIADPLSQSVEEAALSVISVANARLLRQIRRVTIERGHDPADFALVAFGGAGPMQAPLIAAELDMNAVIVPRSPGVFSARGLLIADVQSDTAHHYRGQGRDPGVLTEQYRSLEADISDQFEGQNLDVDRLEVSRKADIRYEGQAYELTVPVPGGEFDQDTIEQVETNFHEMHEQRYGYSRPDENIEIVTLRVDGRIPTPSLETAVDPTTEDPMLGEREVYFAESGYQPTTIYDRMSLDPGQRIDGPAILEETDSTSLVPPGTSARITEHGNVIIEL